MKQSFTVDFEFHVDHAWVVALAFSLQLFCTETVKMSTVACKELCADTVLFFKPTLVASKLFSFIFMKIQEKELVKHVLLSANKETYVPI
jgi:TRAP-type mannitol/chloroaromatic compound transport system permease large subunit